MRYRSVRQRWYVMHINWVPPSISVNVHSHFSVDLPGQWNDGALTISRSSSPIPQHHQINTSFTSKKVCFRVSIDTNLIKNRTIHVYENTRLETHAALPCSRCKGDHDQILHTCAISRTRSNVISALPPTFTAKRLLCLEKHRRIYVVYIIIY